MVRVVTVAEMVEPDAGLRVVTVRGNLHSRPRPVLVKPAHRANILFLPTVAEEIQSVRLCGMHTELGFLAGADPFGPHVADQPVAEQSKRGGLMRADVQQQALDTITVFAECHLAGAGFYVSVDGTRRARSGFGGFRATFKLKQHIAQREITFGTDVSYEHGATLPLKEFSF